MDIVPREEMIDCESWYGLVDYHYMGKDDLPSGIVHCDMGSIPEFFEKISQTDNEYVVVSSRSDFGLFYQANFPPYLDYNKHASMFLNAERTNNGYVGVTLPAPVKHERCNPNHRYSIKCYMFTEATFDEIPPQVKKWFVCNNGVLDDDRVVGIPFGFNGVDGSREARDIIADKLENINWDGDRAKDFYVNFAFYTNERSKLFLLYNRQNWTTCEQSLDFKDYVDRIVEHNTMLCPPGNGLDCYRTLEALYLGCIPIMEHNVLIATYAKLNLPIFVLESLEAVTPPVMDYIKQDPIHYRKNWNLSGITVSYWKNIFDSLRLGIEANG